MQLGRKQSRQRRSSRSASGAKGALEIHVELTGVGCPGDTFRPVSSRELDAPVAFDYRPIAGQSFERASLRVVDGG
jgi:hypothetical protein